MDGSATRMAPYDQCGNHGRAGGGRALRAHPGRWGAAGAGGLDGGERGVAGGGVGAALALGHEDDLAGDAALLQHLLSAASVEERQAGGDARVKLPLAEEVEQLGQVFFERLLVPAIDGGDAVERAAAAGEAGAHEQRREGAQAAERRLAGAHEAVPDDDAALPGGADVLAGGGAAESVEG